MIIDAHDPLAVQVYAAIQGGDVAALKRLLEAEPGLVEARIRGRRGNGRTLLHVATDFPNRVAWVAGLCCFLVAGCGSENPIRPLLGGQGIGNIRFGQTPDGVATGTSLQHKSGRTTQAASSTGVADLRR